MGRMFLFNHHIFGLKATIGCPRRTSSNTHRKKVDVIYIDPHTTRRNKGLIYNDQYVDKGTGPFAFQNGLSFMETQVIVKAKNPYQKDLGVIFTPSA